VLELPDEYAERAAYVVSGEVEAGGRRWSDGGMLLFPAGAATTLRAVAAARLMLLGGAPLDGPREIWWNFVSSSAERLERARLDWREQRFASVPGDAERIPLPEE
jgi:redox-sensitive bicupin YhaK (pirin superfamily)